MRPSESTVSPFPAPKRSESALRASVPLPRASVSGCSISPLRTIVRGPRRLCAAAGCTAARNAMSSSRSGRSRWPHACAMPSRSACIRDEGSAAAGAGAVRSAIARRSEGRSAPVRKEGASGFCGAEGRSASAATAERTERGTPAGRGDPCGAVCVMRLPSFMRVLIA